ncbi:MAG: T9SS type A sorting domain-containing protein [Bacteroidia bacterium]
MGIRVNGLTNSSIRRNKIYNIVNNTTSSLSLYGMHFIANLTNTSIHGNYIDNVSYTGTNYPITRGIHISGTVNANVTLSNNVINRVISSGADFSQFYGPTGIYFDGTGSNYRLYHNTVHLAGQRPINTWIFTSYSYTYSYNLRNAYSAALCINSSAITGIDARNNIFSNVQTSANTTQMGFNFAIFSPTMANFSNLSHNLYWASSAQTGMTNGFQMQNATQTTFQAYRSIATIDRYSSFQRPAFVNDSVLDINLFDSAAWALYGRAVPTLGITRDFNDTLMSTSILTGPNCIGAVNFSLPTIAAPVAIASALPAPNTTTHYFSGGDTIASITWNTMSSVPVDFTLRYYPGKIPSAPHSSARYLRATWELSGIPVTGFDYSIRMFYNPAHLNNISSESNLIGANYFGSVWTPFTFSSIVDSVAKTLTVNNLVMMGEFTGTDNINPLPVKLSRFTVEKQQQNAVLNWSTSSEINSSQFLVERSFNRNDFEEIGSVRAKGNSNRNVNYNFIDRYIVKDAIIKGNNIVYYRLKQIDRNGDFAYSEIRSLNVFNELGSNIAIMPNPFKNHFQLSFAEPTDNVFVKVIDLNGKVVFSNKYNHVESSLTIEAANLKDGVYILNVEHSGKTETYKVIKN